MTKQQISILFLTRLFYPHVGGVEKHVAEVSKILARQGFKIIIISEKTPGKKFKYKNIQHYQIPIKTQGWYKKFVIWRWLFINKQLIKQADIVHCHDVFFWYLPFRLLFLSKPIFTTFHGYESYPVRKKAILARKLSEKLSEGSICVGSFIKKWYGAKPDIVLYGGVSLRNNKQKEFPIPSSALFIGRLDKDTGIVEYANAISLLLGRLPGFELGVVGDGEEKTGLSKRGFKLYGFISDYTKILKNYRFAFVSGYLAILEAFEARKLVFALYNNPLKKDYLLKTPFKQYMVIVGSSKELRDQLLYFVKHPKKEEEKIHKAYEFVQKQTWDNVVSKYKELWGVQR